MRSVDVEVREPAGRDVERRQTATDHDAVEDDPRVGAAFVALEELDDRVAADLLFAVAAEADVHGQLALQRQLAGGGELHVEVALVVDRAAAVEVVAADLGLEGRRVPQLERVRRLHVEVAVAEDGRRVVGARRRADLADHERALPPGDELARRRRNLGRGRAPTRRP